MLWVFHAGPTLFRSGWFVESLATQTLVIFVIRTRRVPVLPQPAKHAAACGHVCLRRRGRPAAVLAARPPARLQAPAARLPRRARLDDRHLPRPGGGRQGVLLPPPAGRTAAGARLSPARAHRASPGGGLECTRESPWVRVRVATARRLRPEQIGKGCALRVDGCGPMRSLRSRLPTSTATGRELAPRGCSSRHLSPEPGALSNRTATDAKAHVVLHRAGLAARKPTGSVARHQRRRGLCRTFARK